MRKPEESGRNTKVEEEFAKEVKVKTEEEFAKEVNVKMDP